MIWKRQRPIGRGRLVVRAAGSILVLAAGLALLAVLIFDPPMVARFGALRIAGALALITAWVVITWRPRASATAGGRHRKSAPPSASP
jgi:hypothetical protein